MIEKKTTPTQISIRDKVEAVIRRRWFIILPVIGGVAISIVVSFFLAPVYEAKATVQINDKKIVDPLVAGLAVSATLKDQANVMVKQMQSWPQLMKIVDQYHLNEKAKTKTALDEIVLGMRKRITIETKGNDMIEISYQDENPEMAQKIANTIAQNFIDESTREKRAEAKNAIEFIGDQLKIYRQKLEESEKNFATHKIESDLRLEMNRKKLLQDQMANLQKIIPSQVRTEHSPVFARLQAHLAELEIEKARLMMDATEEHPRVQELKKEIAEIRQQLDAEMKKEMVRESISMMNPSYLQAEQEMKQIDMELNYLEKRKKELAEGGKVPVKPISEEELSALETSKKVDEDIYQMLLKQMEAAYVSERLQNSDKGARLSIIEYARYPIHPVKPIKMNAMLAGLFGGGVIGFGLMFMMERLDRSFRTAEDAKSVLNIQMLGSTSMILLHENVSVSLVNKIVEKLRKRFQKYKVLSDMRFISPHIAKKPINSKICAQAVIHHDPKCSVSEEYRILRTNIQNLGHDKRLRKIIVTSSVRGEGKSTTSMNLAISFADSGKNTLLVDCDLRRGTLHELMGVSHGPGLTHVLSGNVNCDSAIMKTDIKNLSLLPGGTRPMKPSEMLGSARMESIISKLEEQYDVVLMDAPPVLNIPDTCIISKYSDGVVLVVQAERTQREEVVRAQAMLTQSHAPVIGFVLTNVRYYIPKYLYDYYYGDYDSYSD